MELALGILTDYLISFAIGVPRVFIGEGPPKKSYKEKSQELLEKLPVTKALRAKLTPGELTALEAREQKAFDAITYDRARKAQKPTTAFGDDYIEPPPLERDITAPFAKPTQKITAGSFGDDFILPEGTNLQTEGVKTPLKFLSRFKLPDALYGGPMYSGGRFYEPGEKLNLKDFAAIPISDIDLYARDHDIRVSLAAAAPTEKKRKDLLRTADAIFHHQIFLSHSLSLYHGEITPENKESIRRTVEGITAALRFTEFYKEQARQIEADIETQVRQFELSARQETERFNRQLTRERAASDIVVFPHEDIRVPDHRDVPVDRMFETVEVPPPGSSFEVVERAGDMGVIIHPDVVYEGALNLYSRQPLFEIYAHSPNNIVFNNPEVRRRLQLEVVEPLIQEQRRLINTENFSGLAPSAQHHLDDLTREIEDIIRSQNHQAVRGTNTLPTINEIAIGEQLERTTQASIFGFAKSLLFSAANEILFSKHLNDFIKERPELATEIKTALPDYERDNPITRWAAEILFRVSGSNSVTHQPLTQEEIKEYLDAIELKAENDPFYQLLETPKPKTPVKPAPKPAQNSVVENVAKVGSYKQLKDLFSHQTPQEREETKLAIEKKLIDYDVEELYDFLF